MEKDNLKFSDMFKEMDSNEQKGFLKFANFFLDAMSKIDSKAKVIKLYGEISEIEHDAIKYATEMESVEEEEQDIRAETLCNIFEQYINILKDFQKGN